MPDPGVSGLGNEGLVLRVERVSGLSSGFRLGSQVLGFGIAFREEVDADDGREEGALSARLRPHHCDLRRRSRVGSRV